jgi:hypothetical protein
MIDTKEKTIDGRNVMVVQFPGRRALFFKTRLLKLIGPAIAQMFTGKNPLETEVDFSVVSKALDKLSERLNEDEFVKFVLDLLQCTRLDGKEISGAVFDEEFAGNLLLMYKVLWFTLEVNYGSFFGQSGIGKILSAIPQMREKETKTPQKSSK